MHRITLPMAFAAPGRPPLGAITTSVASASEPGGSGFATTLPGLGAVTQGAVHTLPLLRLTNLETGRDWDFRLEAIPIGRTSPLATDTDPKTFSRERHAEIALKDGKIFITDWSLFGTFLNGERIVSVSEVEVAPGDVLRFGSDPSLPCYLVNLPESERSPLPVDYASIVRDARDRLKVKIAEADRDKKVLLLLPGGNQLLEQSKRREVLAFFSDPLEPYYANLPERAAGLARLYGTFHYLRSTARRSGLPIKVFLCERPDQHIFLIHQVRREGEAYENYVSDPERDLWSAWLSSHQRIVRPDWEEEYETILRSGQTTDPGEVKRRIENETGKFYFPHPIAFVDLEDLFLPPTPPQSAGT